MPGRVEGKVALITGAARGQGRAHAVRLAEEGADIIALDMCESMETVPYPLANEADLKETVRLVESLGRRIHSGIADVRDRSELKRVVDEGVSALGKLDIVVANAGICIATPWDQVTDEIFDDRIDVDLKGAWNTVMVGAPHLIDNGSGSVILTSSAAGLKALPFLVPYTAAKHGVTGLARAFALELAQHNIRVNSLHPTGVATDMADPEVMAKYPGMIAANPRVGAVLTNMLPIELSEAIDQANAVLFLASDEARHVTALAMTVDAGNTQY